jgi:predicted nucleotidyltransferase
MGLRDHEFNVDIAACRASFAAREESRLAERETRRQAALAAAVNALKAILPHHGKVRRAYLFGSVVRSGAFRIDSDVDIAVEGIEAADYFALWRDLEEAMPDWPVDLRDFVPNTNFAERVQRSGQLVYECNKASAEGKMRSMPR